MFADLLRDSRNSYLLLRGGLTWDFEVIIDQIMGGPRFTSPKISITEGLLNQLGIIDEALEVGLQRHLDHRWAIYQFTPTRPLHPIAP